MGMEPIAAPGSAEISTVVEGNKTPQRSARTPSPSPGGEELLLLRTPSPTRRKSTGSRSASRRPSLPPRPSLDGAGSLRTPPKRNLLTSSDDDDEGRAKQQQQQQQGPWFLKLAKSYHAQGDNPLKAFQYATRAIESFERSEEGRSSLDLVVGLHIVAALHCGMGRFEEAVGALTRALEIPDAAAGPEHVLATFAGHMQMGDTLTLMGKHELGLGSYHAALQVQKLALGELDLRVAETCRYVAEAHLQAMQFEEAGKLCELALRIHQEKSSAGSVEEAADRRLMAMVCSGKEDHESALEHLVLSSTVLLANGLESDVASVDATIGDCLVALGRDAEAALSYQKAVTVFKATKGESHALVASVYVRLAELYVKTGKLREAKTYCESALRIWGHHGAGHAVEDIVYGLSDVAGIYDLMNEREQAIALLIRAVDMQGSAPGQHFTAAGIEAQLGVLYFMVGKFPQAHSSLSNSVDKLKAASDGKQTMFLGTLLNQLGLTSVELGEINEAALILEESRGVLEEACGPLHSHTLAVCSNLASTYDALGRTHEAISLLETILDVKEDRLGTMHPEVEDEKERLTKLLNEVGRSRSRKSNTLEELLSMAKFESSRH